MHFLSLPAKSSPLPPGVCPQLCVQEPCENPGRCQDRRLGQDCRVFCLFLYAFPRSLESGERIQVCFTWEGPKVQESKAPRPGSQCPLATGSERHPWVPALYKAPWQVLWGLHWRGNSSYQWALFTVYDIYGTLLRSRGTNSSEKSSLPLRSTHSK